MSAPAPSTSSGTLGEGTGNVEAVGDDGVKQQLEALGEFIRSQRQQAQLSLRELAAKTNVSNPYLSQIERGLHEPSVRVLKAIAHALNLSLETMLVAAGLLGPEEEDGDRPDTESAILHDPDLTEDQRASLLAVYRSYTAR